MRYGNFPDRPNTFQTLQISENFLDHTETFQTIRKLPRPSGNFSVQFQGLRTKTFWTRKNFPRCLDATMVFVPLTANCDQYQLCAPLTQNHRGALVRKVLCIPTSKPISSKSTFTLYSNLNMNSKCAKADPPNS